MQKGFGIIEVVVGSAIILSVVLVSSFAFTKFIQGSRSALDSLKANYCLEEGVEALKFLRDQSYSKNIATLSAGTKYYLVWNGSWATSTSGTLYDGKFERYVSADPVYRDPQGHIVTSGGTLDDQTKKISANVLWNSGNGTTSRNISFYLVNIFSN